MFKNCAITKNVSLDKTANETSATVWGWKYRCEICCAMLLCRNSHLAVTVREKNCCFNRVTEFRNHTTDGLLSGEKCKVTAKEFSDGEPLVSYWQQNVFWEWMGSILQGKDLHIMAQIAASKTYLHNQGTIHFKSPVLLCVGGFINLVLPMLI